jgi:hypothetical protein
MPKLKKCENCYGKGVDWDWGGDTCRRCGGTGQEEVGEFNWLGINKDLTPDEKRDVYGKIAFWVLVVVVVLVLLNS